jgi:hypothetical protein
LLRYLEDEQTTNPAKYEQMVQQLGQSAAQCGTCAGSTNVLSAGFVVKTRSISAKGRKVFINMCSSEQIDEFAPMDAETPLPDGAPLAAPDEVRIRIPLSLGPPREDLDGSGEACRVYDVVFHPATVENARQDREFRDFTMRVVSSQIEAKYGDELEGAWAWPKLRGQYKGISPLPQFIRAKRKVAPAPAAEVGGYAPEPATLAAPAGRQPPIIEEVAPALGAAASRARERALLPAPAYILRPLDAGGRPIGAGEEGRCEADADPDGADADDAAARVPASLELKVHLPLLAAAGRRPPVGGRRGRRGRGRDRAVHLGVGRARDSGRGVLPAARAAPRRARRASRVRVRARALRAAAQPRGSRPDRRGRGHRRLGCAGAGSQGERRGVGGTAFQSEARARKAKQLLQARRRDEALDRASAKAAADAVAKRAAADASARAAAQAQAQAAAAASATARHRAGERPTVARNRPEQHGHV